MPQQQGNTTPTPAQRGNRADTFEHRAYNGTPTPHQDGTNSLGKRSPASSNHSGLASHTTTRNHTDTPHHCHCNDSPGRNIIQLSSTITAQTIQMPVTPHPRRGHNPLTLHAAAPHATLWPAGLITPQATTVSTARPTIRPPSAAPGISL
ncbi:hypothetical protein ILYODFUR_030893 [Ilyodon furcidens]|uniref:Uncharacterized protein n=1 Tax=Ilyodon furcidens TaxID=33524 RepID=A0ABV0SQK6_9TELE